MTDAEFLARFALLRRLGIIALIGALGVVASFLIPEGTPQAACAILSGLAIVPAIVYLLLLCIWHWKSRYRGEHSDLWGGILLIETSGWFKIVYLLRHLMPDAAGKGRYHRASVERSA